MRPVPPKSLQSALDHLKTGGRLCIPTHTRTTVIEQKHVEAWDAHGKALLREDGDGYRLRTGKTSVYLFPGQLKFID